jgi:long-chain acyl-CoA synthetase
MNLYDVFHRTALGQAEHPAFLGPGPRAIMSYAALDEAIQNTSSCLARAGVGPGMCVGLHCPSGANYVIATYAAWRCGAFVMPIPIDLTPPEKEQILRTVAVDSIVSVTNRTEFLEDYQTGRETEIMAGAAVYPVRRLRDHPPELFAMNPAFVRFTSGTTAAAKGVVLSHETVYERIQASNEVLQTGAGDRVVWLLSMAYHFAVTIVSYLTFGAGIILPSNHFARSVLEASRSYVGTVIYGSPTHFGWLASAPEASPLPGLRLAISTTSGLDYGTSNDFRCQFGIPLTQALGIIEVGLPFINYRFAAQRPEAVGQLLPAYELQMSDVGLGEDAREILIRGPGLLNAYYQPWRHRASIMRDGWFHTGDVASIDADGCVTLRGRRKDLINVLGMKFFPQEVEAVLLAHPAVADACVCSRPDPRMGETPEARVILEAGHRPPTERELIAHCERQLAQFKVPRWIHFVDSLSYTDSGKLLHRPAPQNIIR